MKKSFLPIKHCLVLILILIVWGCSTDRKRNGTMSVKTNTTIADYKKADLDTAVSAMVFAAMKSPRYSDKDQFALVSEKTDQLGYNHTRYQQYYDGLLVQGGEYAIHRKDGQITATTGHFYENMRVDTDNDIMNEATALSHALKQLGAEAYTPPPKGKLIIAAINGNFSPDNFRLAWQFDISPTDMSIEPHTVFIDAHTGALVNKISQVYHSDATGTVYTLYNSNPVNITTDYYFDWIGYEYRLRESGRNINTYNSGFLLNFALASDYEDNDNYWNYQGDDNTLAACHVHWAMERTYDYFVNTFGRYSYDGNFSPISSYVDYNFDFGNSYLNQNAAYFDYNNAFAFGDGGPNANYVAGLDVVAHEFLHGVANSESGLIGQNESGALGESFGDMFGAIIEFEVYGTGGNYLHGEDAYDFTDCDRSLQDPTSKGHSKCYHDNYWVWGSNDNGGIHSNCGVQNYWFYLLCEGGMGTNYFGNSYNVTAIGREAAAAIIYRNITNYLQSNSDYNDAYIGSVLAAIDLYGLSSVEYRSVKEAWYAVGIGERQDCAATTVLNAQSGTFSDNSGSGNYADFTYCTWRIQPPGASSITLNFEQFNTEYLYDYVRVYAGPNEYAPLVGSFSGGTLPSSIIVASGQVLVAFSSDYSYNSSGWTISYNSNLATTNINLPAAGASTISVWPNPTEDVMYVANPNCAVASVVLSDMSGKPCLGNGVIIDCSNPLRLNVSGLASGVYVVTVVQKNGQQDKIKVFKK